MADSNSPLRYPGGKAVLSEFLAATISENGIADCTYMEPYAGGAGAALNLLLEKKVARILLNDADRAVWSFWHAALHHTDSLIEKIESTAVTVAEWRRQRALYLEAPRRIVDLGFAAFFLNRCNRSGIMTNGGIIGGIDQTGKWKIDARYNKPELIRRIRAIAALRDQIQVSNLDAIEFLRMFIPKRNRLNYLVYLDPPYFVKGSRLYLNYYEERDHAALATYLRRLRGLKWLVTYDNVPRIRELYEWPGNQITDFNLHYSAAVSREGSEILIASNEVVVPTDKLQRQTA